MSTIVCRAQSIISLLFLSVLTDGTGHLSIPAILAVMWGWPHQAWHQGPCPHARLPAGRASLPVCGAKLPKKSTHPGRQSKRGFDELLGSPTEWLTVPIPAGPVAKGTAKPRHVSNRPNVKRQQAGPHKPDHATYDATAGPASQGRSNNTEPGSHPLSLQAQQDLPGADEPSRSQTSVRGSMSGPTKRQQGRYLRSHQPNVQSAAQVLHAASQLAALPGPHMTLHGSRLRERLGPIKKWQFAGVAGQTNNLWWHWQRWLAHRRRLYRQRQLCAQSPSSSHLQGTTPGGLLCMLDMDDVDLDLDDFDEALPQHVLHRSKQEMDAAIAASTLRQLKQLALAVQAGTQQQQAGSTCTRPGQAVKRPSQGPGAQAVERLLSVLPVRIFKGGGYVAADLAVVLKNSGLAPVLHMQLSLAGAHCILAMPRWKNNKPVNLQQQRAAALNRGIPLVLTRSLRPKDVLLAMRPLLLEMGLLGNDPAARDRKIIHLTQEDSARQYSGDSSLQIRPALAVAPSTAPPVSKAELLTRLLDGGIRVVDFINLSAAYSNADDSEELQP